MTMYIQKLEIKNLWGSDFLWTLNKDVNVLIGKNGLGKSTLLKMLHEAVLPVEDERLNFTLFYPIDEMIVELDNDIVITVSSESRSITSITGNQSVKDYNFNLSFIDTFDVVERGLTTTPNTTLLDYKLIQLKHNFVTYQRDLSNQVEEALTTDDQELRKEKLASIADIYEPKNIFVKILNDLFSETDKQFDEKAFHFLKKGVQTPILPENLSSGEKQILIILLTTLLQDRRDHVLLMDEPEISLHIDWQRSLIENIRLINPNCQIITVTHSPTIYYQGWIEKVTRIGNIKSQYALTDESTIIVEQKTSEKSQNNVQKIKHDFQGFSGDKPLRLYKFNRTINAYTSFTKDECIELLEFLKKENDIYPDIITFTTLISKVNSYAEAKDIFDLIETERYTYLSHVKPNDITLNTLMKKVRGVQEGLQLIEEVSKNENFQLYPDIITFSTLLGKAKNMDEIRLLEDFRDYYGIKANDIYLKKLNAKK